MPPSKAEIKAGIEALDRIYHATKDVSDEDSVRAVLTAAEAVRNDGERFLVKALRGCERSMTAAAQQAGGERVFSGWESATFSGALQIARQALAAHATVSEEG